MLTFPLVYENGIETTTTTTKTQFRVEGIVSGHKVGTVLKNGTPVVPLTRFYRDSTTGAKLNDLLATTGKYGGPSLPEGNYVSRQSSFDTGAIVDGTTDFVETESGLNLSPNDCTYTPIVPASPFYSFGGLILWSGDISIPENSLLPIVFGLYGNYSDNGDNYDVVVGDTPFTVSFRSSSASGVAGFRIQFSIDVVKAPFSGSGHEFTVSYIFRGIFDNTVTDAGIAYTPERLFDNGFNAATIEYRVGDGSLVSGSVEATITDNVGVNDDLVCQGSFSISDANLRALRSPIEFRLLFENTLRTRWSQLVLSTDFDVQIEDEEVDTSNSFSLTSSTIDVEAYRTGGDSGETFPDRTSRPVSIPTAITTTQPTIFRIEGSGETDFNFISFDRYGLSTVVKRTVEFGGKSPFFVHPAGFLMSATKDGTNTKISTYTASPTGKETIATIANASPVSIDRQRETGSIFAGIKRGSGFFMAKSTDDGATFTDMAQAFDSTHKAHDTELLFGATMGAVATKAGTIYYKSSFDSGATWEAAVVVGTAPAGMKALALRQHIIRGKDTLTITDSVTCRFDSTSDGVTWAAIV